MLKKMLKTILVLSLCIGVVLPTNAAVSVSDGSAFVTKAEFAADLNNLSNRMAQLENSLDAKIDSLVSSYLTRNGIWNGGTQTIQGKTKEFTNASLFIPSVEAYKSASANLWNEQFSCSKAGMLFINLSLKLVEPTNKTSWKAYLMSGTEYSANDSARVFGIRIKDSAHVYYDQPFISNIGVGTYLLMPLPLNANYIIQCFVPKDTLSFTIYDFWSNTYRTALSTRTDLGFWLNGGSMKFEIVTAQVY